MSNFKQVLPEIINSLKSTSGEDFFNALTLQLNKHTGADYTLIAKLNHNSYSSKTISLVAKGQLAENFEYSLKNTPCAEVNDNSVCIYPQNICSLYPHDQLLIDMKIEAYLGAPLHDSKQNVIGHIVTMYEGPLEDDHEVITLFKVFSGRIAAELERRNYEASLEEKVLARTLELSTTIEQLQLAQKQLADSDKMAALGSLVAGVAHEVNTPLGIAITTNSIIADEHKQLNDKITNERLSMKDMTHYCQAVDNALIMQGENLIRAKNLIENFKKTAVDQHQIELETINIKDYYHKVVSTINSILKKKKASITITGEENINLATYPGIHAQILTNFITNSIRHGFNGIEGNHIGINIIKKDNLVEVHYQDNGVGLSKEAQKHVFDPFFTTARKSGGVGLGMSIVYNLITQKLHGKIFIDKNSSGACFIYQFKEST